MSQKGRTLDERFLIKLYEMAMKEGDPFSAVDIRALSRLLNQREVAVRNVVKFLAQANFIEKVDETTIYLTRRGCDFVVEEF